MLLHNVPVRLCGTVQLHRAYRGARKAYETPSGRPTRATKKIKAVPINVKAVGSAGLSRPTHLPATTLLPFVQAPSHLSVGKAESRDQRASFRSICLGARHMIRQAASRVPKFSALEKNSHSTLGGALLAHDVEVSHNSVKGGMKFSFVSNVAVSIQ